MFSRSWRVGELAPSLRSPCCWARISTELYYERQKLSQTRPVGKYHRSPHSELPSSPRLLSQLSLPQPYPGLLPPRSSPRIKPCSRKTDQGSSTGASLRSSSHPKPTCSLPLPLPAPPPAPSRQRRLPPLSHARPRNDVRPTRPKEARAPPRPSPLPPVPSALTPSWQPFLDPPTTPRTSRQSFSAPLSALLTSQISHVARPPSAANLLSPPSLPPRAFPTSEDARLLGPLTAQRVKKIKLRYWNDQTGKLRAPIAVVVRREGEELSLEESTEVLERLGLGGVRLEEGRKVLEDLERKARVGEVPRKPRRLQSRAERATKGPTVKQGEGGKERKELRILSPSSKNSKWHLPKTLSPRLLRRRYQAILHDSPILVISESSSPPPRPSSKKPSSTSPPIPQPSDPTASPTKTTTFVVRRSDGAKGGTAGMGIFSEEDRWWLAQDEVMFGRSKESKSRRGGREKR